MSPRKSSSPIEPVPNEPEPGPGPDEDEPPIDESEPDPAELEDVALTADVPLLEEGHDDGEEHALAPLAPPSARALARYDPLDQYMSEIRQYPLLTREEEHELAVRYVKTGDREAAKRLVTANLRLVVKIAHEYRRAYRSLLDLIQEGNIGLLQAVRKYDPYRGVKLSSYAAWWIRAYILRFILNNWRLVKIGTTQAQRKLFYNLRKAKELLAQQGFVPETKLLAEHLDVSEQEVEDMEKRLDAGEHSLDAPVNQGEEGGRTQLDVLASSNTAPDVAAEADEFRDLLRAKLDTFAATLHGRKLMIFKERLHSDSPLTLQEIGDHYGITRERARQIENELASDLRDYLRREMGSAVEVAMGLED